MKPLTCDLIIASFWKSMVSKHHDWKQPSPVMCVNRRFALRVEALVHLSKGNTISWQARETQSEPVPVHLRTISKTSLQALQGPTARMRSLFTSQRGKGWAGNFSFFSIEARFSPVPSGYTVSSSVEAGHEKSLPKHWTRKKTWC